MTDDDVGLRVRRVATGCGEVYTALSVYCARVDRSVSLAECEQCPQCRGLHYDEHERRSFVSCRPRVDPRAAALWTGAPKRVLPTAADRVPISSVMNGDVICVTADYSIEALTALLLERGFSGAPVVDDRGRPIGVVSKTDLLREQFVAGCETAGDLMMPIAFTLPETAPLSQAAALMVEEGVHRLPIVSADGQVVGILSAFDVMRWLAGESGYERQARR